MKKPITSQPEEISQADLLKGIVENYQTSATYPDENKVEQFTPLEDETMAPYSIIDTADGDNSDEYALEKLHLRNKAQTKHINFSEKAALAHWTK